MSLTETITYGFLKLLSKLFQVLSHNMRNKTGDALGRFAYKRIPKRQEEALKNIQIAFPEKSETDHGNILKNTYQLFMRNAVQFLAFPKSFQEFTFTVEGKEILDRAMARDKGVIFITGHCGAWELLIAWLGKNGYPFEGVAAEQSNLGADKLFREQREYFKVKQIPRSTPIDTIMETLTSKKILGLVSDQDAGPKGIFVSFFGKQASTPKGPSVFHLKTGAALIFGTAFYEGRNTFHIQIREIIPEDNDVTTITQSFISMLEEKIKQYPSQYFWFHRRWKSSPQRKGA